MKRKFDDTFLLTEKIELINLYNDDKYYKNKYKLGDLHVRQVYQILKHTASRYKKFLLNTTVYEFHKIKINIFKYLHYFNEYNQENEEKCLEKYDELMSIMDEIDNLILEELNENK